MLKVLGHLVLIVAALSHGEALAQAQSIATEIEAKADSELAKMIVDTTEFLEVEP